MAVAVKTSPETAPQRPLNRLAVSSLLGTIYVLACLAIIYAIPVAWGEVISPAVVGTAGLFVDAALRLLVILAVVVGLVLLGRRLVGPNPPRGLRAGICAGIIGVLIIGFITRGIGAALERNLGQNGATAGIAVTVAIGVALLLAGAMSFFKTGFERWLVLIEDQGWFNMAAYKRTQGQRVRRATILGILIVAGTGIYTLLSHKSLDTAGDWAVSLPFTQGKSLLLLPDVKFTVPLLLAVVSLWFAYRVVNFPIFADFLIATEAEMNKVSWPTRKRLIQDTVVVLTTMLLLTGFLFIADTIWIKMLDNPWVNVLQAGESTDTQAIDAQIDKLRQEKAALGTNDPQKADQITSEIESLVQQRESVLRGKQGGPQEW